MANQLEPATAGGSAAGSEAGTPDRNAYSGVRTGLAPEDVAPFVSQVPGTPVSFPSFHGRKISWFAVSLIMVAFLIGGLALVFVVWWLFWAALGLAVVGLLLTLAVNTFDDWY